MKIKSCPEIEIYISKQDKDKFHQKEMEKATALYSTWTLQDNKIELNWILNYLKG